MLKKMVFLALLWALIPAQTFSVDSPHVVINAFRIEGVGGTTDEFVELYNPGDSEIDLTGWRLSKRTATGNTDSNLLTTFPEIKLGSKLSLKIGHKNTTEKIDYYYSTSGSLALNNTIRLYSDAGKTLVDKVGYGEVGDFEGAATLNPDGSEILSREEGLDTDNNYDDFYAETIPEGPETDPEKIYDLSITELLPNPEGSDSDNEWIEIKNNGAVIDLGGLILRDKLGSPHQYKIPPGTLVPAFGYLVFPSVKTRISLNNDGDIVELVSGSGELLDSTEINYEKAIEGASLALFGDTWEWTTELTPGKGNILKEPVFEAVKSKLKKPKKTKKPKKKIGDVLGEYIESPLENLNEVSAKINPKEKWLGIGMIVVALLGMIIYTLYVKKEKAFAIYKQTIERYARIREKIRAKLPRR